MYYASLLCSSFSGKEEGQTEKEKQIDQIYFAYGKKLSPIAEVRYKALDIKDESLGSLFEKFHSEMHNIDTMILSALKASFEVFQIYSMLICQRHIVQMIKILWYSFLSMILGCC